MRNKLIALLLLALLIMCVAVIPHLPKGDKQVVEETVTEPTEETVEQFVTDDHVVDLGGVKLNVYDMEKQIFQCNKDSFYEENLSNFCAVCFGAFGLQNSVPAEQLTELYNNILKLCETDDVIYLVGKPSENNKIFIHVCNVADYTTYKESYEVGN